MTTTATMSKALADRIHDCLPAGHPRNAPLATPVNIPAALASDLIQHLDTAVLTAAPADGPQE
jgi:hypothetical protein